MRKPITDLMRELNAGAFVEEATGALGELTAACQRTNKPGEITLKLKLIPGKAGANGQSSVMQVEHSYKVKSPDFDRGADYLFVTSQGDLVRDNPQQHKLNLTEVKRDAGPIVDVNTGEVVGNAGAQGKPVVITPPAPPAATA